jgi:hypothetical protein
MKYFLFLLLPFAAFGQHTYVPNHSDLHHLADRMDIMGLSNIHTGVNQHSSRIMFQEVVTSYNTLSFTDRYLAKKLIRTYPEFWGYISKEEEINKEYIDSSQVFYTESTGFSPLEEVIEPSKPLLKYFYENRNYFTQIKAKNFLLKINPILLFGAGSDFPNDEYTFENRRGIALSGHINDKIYFYTDILESQSAFPKYIDNYITEFKALPGNGFYKNYQSGVLDGLNGYDFLNATAYVNARITKGIGVEFGNGKHFLGNGNRSLLLSDFSNNYLYLKFNTNIWKLHYQNLFTELIPISFKDNPTGQIIPRKYMTAHYLSFKHKNIELGVFESVIFERDGNFDLQYLNPIILYRLVEYNLASSDNVLIGANGKWNIAKRLQLYGQILFDEFLLRELLIERQGWWANKFGIQAGAKYINAFGLDNLDLELEYNRIRPFTYGHRSRANFSHANQSLAHPLGANLTELSLRAQYYITPKLTVSSENYFIQQGIDTDSTYFGADILRPSGERKSQYGHSHLQGAFTTTLFSQNKVSYELLPNYFLDLNLIYRDQSSDLLNLNFTNFMLSGAIRINFWEPKLHI